MTRLLDFNNNDLNNQTHSPIPRLQNDNFPSLFADATTYEESSCLTLPIHYSSDNTLPLTTTTATSTNRQVSDLKEPNHRQQQSDQYDSSGLDIRDLFDGQLDL